MGVLALMIAVFGWGLQYKLSLYQHPGSHSRSVSQAKLLSQKERAEASDNQDLAAKVDSDQRILIAGPTLLAAAIVLSPLASLLLWFRIDAMRGTSSHLRFAASNFFAFRPPPSSLLFS
jgi:hypothetical protein